VQYVRLGRTGLEVSRLCLGCMSFGVPDETRPWILEDEAARPLFQRAWESGITFFDTANIYASGTSEELTGRMLKQLGGRDSYVLATKLYNRMSQGPNGAGLSRKSIFAEIDNSLRRLGTDYVDLYQIHRWDYFTPIEETLEALHEIVKAGKVRYVGASSMFAWQFAKALFTADRHGWTRFVSMQNEVNLLYREEEREMLPLCADQGIGVIPWGPLGGGKLTRPWGERTKRNQTDRYNKHMYEQTEGGAVDVVAAVESLAASRGVPMAQIALAWTMQKDAVTGPIIGATKPEHIDDAVKALDLRLSEEEITDLEAPYQARLAASYITLDEALVRGRPWQPAGR
jgi:1-deoxyxylulose-5-phosphate synthase